MQDTRCVSCCSMVKGTTTTKCKHQTLPPNASSNGGDASRGIKTKVNTLPNKDSQTVVITHLSVSLCLDPDARRVAPISGRVSSSDKRYH